MGETQLYPRFAERRLVEALEDTPVVVIHGARQSGKTTLARAVGAARGYEYFTFDDDATLRAAAADPVGFVADAPERVVIDEVQRVPELFPALKMVVDRRRTPGRFILTGSSNLLTLPAVAQSLAGRMEVIRLRPLAQCEMAGTPSRFLDVLFDGAFGTRRLDRLGQGLAARIAAGGYPAALARTSTRRRVAWYRSYLDSVVQRDVRDLTRVRSLEVLPRLLQLAAAQTAGLLNVSELAGPFQLSRPTISGYVSLLEQLFLLETVPPWQRNRLRRLVKRPKLHVSDTGVAAALLGLNAEALTRDRAIWGQLVETFVAQELRRLASWHEVEVRLHHFRDRDGAEVDVVLERGALEVAGIEVKAAASVRPADFRGLRKLAAAAGRAFRAGAVLYDGETCASFGDRLFAVPIRLLWESGA